MTPKKTFHLVTESITKTFDSSECLISASKTEEELKERLTKVIGYLLDSNFEKLISIMYRIDINEDQFKRALNEDHVSEKMADLVIKRFVQKAEIRLKYSSS